MKGDEVMKIMLFGISISLFGIAWILACSGCCSGAAITPGYFVSLAGLLVALVGLIKRDRK
jgi:hypothetical protein